MGERIEITTHKKIYCKRSQQVKKNKQLITKNERTIDQNIGWWFLVVDVVFPIFFGIVAFFCWLVVG